MPVESRGDPPAQAEPMTDAELLAALEAAAVPLADGARYAMPSTSGADAVRNAIRALSPTARDLLSWVARHHGQVLWVDTFAGWAGVSRDEALAAIGDLASRVAVHRTGRRGGRETWRLAYLAQCGTRLEDAETGGLDAVVISLGAWVGDCPELASAWRVRPFDPRPSAEIWRRATGDKTDG